MTARPKVTAKPLAGGEQIIQVPQQVRDNSGSTALRALLHIETTIRKLKRENELYFLIANEARGLVRARQIFVLTIEQGKGRVVAISGLPSVDRTAPLVQSIETAIQRLGRDGSLAKRCEFNLSGVASDDSARSYPLREMLWVPMGAADMFGGILFAREVPWLEGDVAVAEHIADATGYAVSAMRRTRAPAFGGLRKRFGSKLAMLAAVAAIALGFWPVSMTVLAPLEVAAESPYVVASGLDGVVDQIVVDPNANVKTGDLLVRLVQVELRNKLEVAEREVQVASAKLQKATQLAFTDMRGRQEMGVARAELDLRVAERDYVRDQFALTELKAARDGVAVYGDRKDLVGRPVQVGDRLMEVADPARVVLHVDVPVGDAIVIKPGARVKVFLDSDPLRPVNAHILEADYQARPRDGATLAYRAVAKFDEQVTPRLGVRGTGQVYGDKVSLWFYLLRRPISAGRQWLGI